LVSNLDRDRFNPIVVVPEDGPLIPLLNDLRVKVHIRPLCILHRTLSPKYWIHTLFEIPPTRKYLCKLVEDLDIRLIHSNSSHVFDGAMAARATGIPHAWHIRELHTGLSKIGRPLSRFIYSYSDAIIAISQAVCEAFFERCLYDPKLHVIYNGVDTREFASISGTTVRSALGLGHNVPLVGMVGRIAHWKGHRVFVEAASIVHEKLPQARFLIVGDGVVPADYRLKRDLQSLVHKLGLDGVVIFTGVRTDIPEVMAALDVLVLPSTYPEPLGRVVLEAMASARPVVATNHGGPVEIVRDGETGYLVLPGDPQKTAEAILTLLRNPTLSSQMGAAGRNLCTQFYTTESTAQAVMQLYEKLLTR